MAEALSDVRVLEVTAPPPAETPVAASGLAAAYGGVLLAGLGADVIRVEPLRGDPARRQGPFPGDRPHPDHGGQFWYLNAAKRGIAIDLGHAAGRRLLHRLAARADVVVHDAAPAAAHSLGLADAALREARPDVIHVAVTPFGQEGPYRDLPATDLQQQALSGLQDLTGEPDREPLAIGAPVAEYAAGQLVAAAALTALHACREAADGRGEFVDVSVLEAACSIMEHSMALWQYRGMVRRRTGNWGGVSAWGIYPCRDGYVGVVSGLGETYQRFRRLIGGALLDDAFDTIAARTALASEMDAAIVEWLAGRTKDDAFHTAQRAKIPFSALATPADVVASAQLQARGYLDPQPMPGHDGVVMPGPPFQMNGDAHADDRPGWRSGPAPRLGEHTGALLRDDLGLSAAEVARLRRAGVVR